MARGSFSLTSLRCTCTPGRRKAIGSPPFLLPASTTWILHSKPPGPLIRTLTLFSSNLLPRSCSASSALLPHFRSASPACSAPGSCRPHASQTTCFQRCNPDSLFQAKGALILLLSPGPTHCHCLQSAARVRGLLRVGCPSQFRRHLEVPALHKFPGCSGISQPLTSLNTALWSPISAKCLLLLGLSGCKDRVLGLQSLL